MASSSLRDYLKEKGKLRSVGEKGPLPVPEWEELDAKMASLRAEQETRKETRKRARARAAAEAEARVRASAAFAEAGAETRPWWRRREALLGALALLLALSSARMRANPLLLVARTAVLAAVGVLVAYLKSRRSA
mmetsp:Transcript_19708/g.64086  ORF Transcript_19708/g.64086 Transcript_19708/m.64086 type:complete len:135 (-) Transcript_19708:132-536(-)